MAKGAKARGRKITYRNSLYLYFYLKIYLNKLRKEKTDLYLQTKHKKYLSK